MKKIIITLVAVALIGVAYYFIAPTFNTVEVQDEIPTFTNAENIDPSVASGFADLTEVEQEEMLRQLFEANRQRKDSMEDDMDMVMPVEPVASPVMATAGHPASGVMKVFDTPTGQIIRFEDFETINGPRLHLYLSKDLEGEEYLDLGPIRGTSGNINYEVPAGVDLSEYKYVMHWCVPFNVLFNYAELQL